MIETYIDHVCKVRDTARALKRSPHTVKRHIEDHMLEVLRDGYCARCKRVNGHEPSNALGKSPSAEDLLARNIKTSVL